MPSAYLKRVVHHHYKIPEKNIKIIFNAIAPGKIKHTPQSTRERSIVTVGRLVPWKNMAGMIRAFSMLHRSDISLKIIGSGPELEPLKQLAEELQISTQVRFLGSLSHNETLQHIVKSEIPTTA